MAMTTEFNYSLSAEQDVLDQEDKFSPWFPGTVDPVRDGVYLTEDADENEGDFYFNLFFRGQWHWGNAILGDAGDDGVMPRSNVKRWRGMVAKDTVFE